jgi:eukaryotic-like serine/threonine-protein kinase
MSRTGIDAHAELIRALAPRYLIREEVGRGGMAHVFLAEDQRSGRLVAVKVLRSELAMSLGAQRFHREIQFLATLDHPNILPAIDSDEADGFLFYVMPYADGETLRARIDRDGALPLDTVLSIADDLASAVDYAHGRNIIHRDIKPENVILVDGRALLCDFGVARALIVATNDGVSSSGLAVGTPFYMSPEQAIEGRTVDGSTDIYALGCVLYEMLTGERPFSGPNAQAVIARHISQPPRSIRTVRPEVPPHIESAVHAALAKYSHERPPTAHALIQRLRGRQG